MIWTIPASPPSFAWEMSVRLRWDGGRHASGMYHEGRRISNSVAGGEFSGPTVRGTLLAGGAAAGR